MKIIECKNICRDFKIRQKEKGVLKNLKSLFKSNYKIIRAVNNLSFSVDNGERIAFLGPNGAGKSTTIKMLVGILHKTSGEISVFGLDPEKYRTKLAYKIGAVFGQSEQLWPNLTPRENFNFFGSVYNIGKDVIEEKIREFEKSFDLSKLLDIPVKSLSLGQKIGCELIVSLIHSPEILFLDEPTIGLDPVIKDMVRKLILTMNRKYNTTIFLTSHDIGDIESICNRIIIINHGKIMIDGSTSEIKKIFKNESLEKIISEIYVKGE